MREKRANNVTVYRAHRKLIACVTPLFSRILAPPRVTSLLATRIMLSA